MCIVAYKPSTATIPEENLRACHSNNPDGWGIMWADQGKLQFVKSMEGFDKFLEEYNRLKDDFDLGLHFRIKTHGAKDQERCHPFVAATDENDEPQWLMMHNGIIPGVASDTHKSDTIMFIEHELKPVLDMDPEMLRNVGYQLTLANRITYNKLLFMDIHGRSLIFNKKNGEDDFDGCWFSNTSYKPRTWASYNNSYGSSSTYKAPAKNGNGGSTVTKTQTQCTVPPKKETKGSVIDEQHPYETNLEYRARIESYGEMSIGEIGLAIKYDREQLDAAMEKAKAGAMPRNVLSLASNKEKDSSDTPFPGSQTSSASSSTAALLSQEPITADCENPELDFPSASDVQDDEPWDGTDPADRGEDDESYQEGYADEENPNLYGLSGIDDWFDEEKKDWFFNSLRNPLAPTSEAAGLAGLDLEQMLAYVQMYPAQAAWRLYADYGFVDQGVHRSSIHLS